MESMKTTGRDIWTAMAGALFLALAPGAVVLAHEYKAGGIEVAHPWARATPGGASVGAAYLEIKSTDANGDKLVSASSPAAGRVELHTHEHADGVMRMRRLESVEVPPQSTVLFAPSGYHVMLLDLKKPLVEGDLLPLTFVFEKAGPITVDATIEPIGAKGPHGLDHQPGHEGH